MGYVPQSVAYALDRGPWAGLIASQGWDYATTMTLIECLEGALFDDVKPQEPPDDWAE